MLLNYYSQHQRYLIKFHPLVLTSVVKLPKLTITTIKKGEMPSTRSCTNGRSPYLILYGAVLRMLGYRLYTTTTQTQYVYVLLQHIRLSASTFGCVMNASNGRNFSYSYINGYMKHITTTPNVASIRSI